MNEREIDGKLMGLLFSWLCKSSMTILCNGFGGQGPKQLTWESDPIGSDLLWIVIFSVIITGSPYDGH